MFRNYLQIALRNLVRHRLFSAINLFGLAVGFACFLLILLFVQNEFGYDRFHAKASRIYRVVIRSNFDGNVGYSPASSAPIGPALARDYPQVTAAARFYPTNAIVGHEDKRFKEQNLYFADSSIFDVFSFPVLKGDPGTALREPYSLVATESFARKYFGDNDPIGQTLRLDNRYDFKVTALLADIPANSHLRFDALVSYATAQALGVNQHIGHFGYATYVLLSPGASPGEIEAHSTEFVSKYFGADYKDRFGILLQPLARIHLYSYGDFGISSGGDIRYVAILLLIGALVLLMACVNYTNLATAMSSQRAREIGMRKVLGAARWNLVAQFLGESLLLSLGALAIAVALLELALPYANTALGTSLTTGYRAYIRVLPEMLATALAVGMVAGAYPALFLSRLQVAEVVKGGGRMGSGKPNLRRVLVVFQFTISIALITSAAVIHDQIVFMQESDLGFDGTQVVILNLGESPVRGSIDAFKAELMKSSDIVSCAASSGIPGGGAFSDPFRPEGFAPDNYTTMNALAVDFDFIKTYGLRMATGRPFSALTADRDSAVLINEAAAREFGWLSPVGKKIQWLSGTQNPYTVVGVVKDFHLNSLHTVVRPLALQVVPDYFSMISVKVRPGNSSEALAYIRDTWRRFSPDYPMEYYFLSDILRSQYQTEDAAFALLGYFSILGVLIACSGLFGLASYALARRTREIGIRKALGADARTIFRLFLREFVVLVALSNLLAWPIAYFAMGRWLEDFAYRITPGIATFVSAGLVSLGIALLTVSYQAWRAARTSPAESLRNE